MRPPGEPADPFLRHFERDSAIACLAMAGAGSAITGRWDVGAGVLAGGGLMLASYLSIKGSVEAAARALVPGEAPAGTAPTAGEPRAAARRALVAAAKYLARYALLAVAAYGILTCFHLHPAGLLAGALSPFLGALGLLVRMSRGWRGAGRPL